MNFRWKEAVWLALDDCGDNPDTQCVYLNVLKYKELNEFQKEIDNQKVHQKYQNTMRNILNGFRQQYFIQGSKENQELKYGSYKWFGVFVDKQKRAHVRKSLELGLSMEQAIINAMFSGSNKYLI